MHFLNTFEYKSGGMSCWKRCQVCEWGSGTEQRACSLLFYAGRGNFLKIFELVSHAIMLTHLQVRNVWGKPER